MDDQDIRLQMFMLYMINSGVNPATVSDISLLITSGKGNPLSTLSISKELFGIYDSGSITADQLSALLTLSQSYTGWSTSLYPSYDSLDGVERLYLALSVQGLSVQQEGDLRQILSTGSEEEVNAVLWELINSGYNIGTTGMPGENPDEIVKGAMDLIRENRTDWGYGDGGAEGKVPTFSIKVTGRSVTVFVNNSSIDNYHRYRIQTASSSVLDTRVQMTSYTYSGLMPGIEYSVDVAYGKRQDGSDERWLSAKVFYSSPIISNFTVKQKQKGEKEVLYSFSVSDISPNATYDLVRTNPNDQGATIQLLSGTLRRSEAGYGTDNGSGLLSVSTFGTFSFKLTITNTNGGTAQQVLSVDISEKETLEHFLWTTANYPDESDGATSEQTKAAYQAITYQGNLSDFSYKVWNDLCHRVKDTAEYVGSAWDEGYLSYQNTQMSSTDKVITASRFNSLNYNIRLRYATGVDYQSKGDQIMGSYFTTMVNALNGWIDIAKKKE